MNVGRVTKITAGVLLGVAGLTLSAVAVGHVAFDRKVRDETAELLSAAEPGAGPMVTEEMVAALPDPVGRYLRFTGVVGKPIPRTVRLRQAGYMRMSPGADPVDLEAEQWYTTSPPGFVWDGSLRKGPLPVARARDRYAAGNGAMYVRAAEFYPIADDTGPEMDQGAMMRYLQEMIAWFPAALLNDYASFTQVDEDTVDVTFTDRGRSVTGRLHLGPDGRYVDFVAKRYRGMDEDFELTTWRAPLTGYAEMNGLRVGVRGTGVWELEDGDYDYIEPVVTELEYDVAP